MGPQPPSLPHTGASRRARRSPFADTTKGVWCRLPPQLLSRSSYAWFWPSFHWKLRTHSATRFLAAPDTDRKSTRLILRSKPGVWCRLPPQLLSRSSYAWFWPSFHRKLRTHSATRFLAAPD